MTKYAWTGSRAPEGTGRFPILVETMIVLDVATKVKHGDEVGVGGCNGVDEIVLAAAIHLRDLGAGIRVVVFPADGERTWPETRADIRLICQADEVHWREKGWKYLERGRALVEWADWVRAMPLIDFKYRRDGTIVMERGGTNYTARYAQSYSKLDQIIPLDSILSFLR